MLRALGRRHTHSILTRIATRPATASEVSGDLDLPLSTVVNYLTELEEVAVLDSRSERSRTRPVKRFHLVSNPVRLELRFTPDPGTGGASEEDGRAYLVALSQTLAEALGQRLEWDAGQDPWVEVAAQHARLRQRRGPRFLRIMSRAALSRLEGDAQRRILDRLPKEVA